MATTSKAHTAIKIAHHYEGAVVQVPDASLVVNVCNDLTQEDKKENYLTELKAEQKRIKEQHEKRGERKLVSLSESRSRGFIIDWEKKAFHNPSRKSLGFIRLRQN